MHATLARTGFLHCINLHVHTLLCNSWLNLQSFLFLIIAILFTDWSLKPSSIKWMSFISLPSALQLGPPLIPTTGISTLLNWASLHSCTQIHWHLLIYKTVTGIIKKKPSYLQYLLNIHNFSRSLCSCSCINHF